MFSLVCTFLQGLSDQAIHAFRVMRADGIKPTVLALNSLINAFGEDRRDADAFSVLGFMKQHVGILHYMLPILTNKQSRGF